MVSVIIPAYNAADSIKRALDSLCSQSYEDIEIIIINDGSTDDTLKICHEASMSDTRIRVLSQQQSGPGLARNKGLSVANGEYVYFMDSDDTVDVSAIGKCVGYMKENDLDLLVFGFAIIDESSVTIERVFFEDCLAINKEELAAAYVPNFLKTRHGNGFLWNKFYRRDIIEENSIRFATDNIMEDELFNIDYYCHISRCRFVDDILYNYYWATSTSIRSKYNPTYLYTLKKVHYAFFSLKASCQIKDGLFDDIVNQRSWNGLYGYLSDKIFKSNSHLSIREIVNRFHELASDSVFRSIGKYQSEKNVLRTIEKPLYFSMEHNDAVLFLIISVLYYIFRPLKWIKRQQH